MYVESHTLGMAIIAVPPRTLVQWYLYTIYYNVFGNGRQVISIPSEWLSTHIQRRAWAHSTLSSLYSWSQEVKKKTAPENEDISYNQDT